MYKTEPGCGMEKTMEESECDSTKQWISSMIGGRIREEINQVEKTKRKMDKRGRQRERVKLRRRLGGGGDGRGEQTVFCDHCKKCCFL